MRQKVLEITGCNLRAFNWKTATYLQKNMLQQEEIMRMQTGHISHSEHNHFEKYPKDHTKSLPDKKR